MNATFKTILATSLAAFASTAALAQEATYEYPSAYTSDVTRAQVQAELAQARRDGSMRVHSTSYNHMAAARSLKTRAEVVAETLADRRAPAGALNAAALQGEDSGSFALARQLPRRDSGTRIAQVR
jgi:hypothetical protein